MSITSTDHCNSQLQQAEKQRSNNSNSNSKKVVYQCLTSPQNMLNSRVAQSNH